MNQTYRNIAFLVIGLVLGFFLNWMLTTPEIIPLVKEKKVVVEKVKEKIIRDTVEVDKIITIETNNDSLMIYSLTDTDALIDEDTLHITKGDSSSEEEIFKERIDEEENEEDEILQERLISSSVISLPEMKIDSTDVSELLDLKSKAFSSSILVEFWESPLGLTGYELTRNRLKLFGFNPSEKFSIQRIENEESTLKYQTSSVDLNLKKSNQFVSIKIK